MEFRDGELARAALPVALENIPSAAFLISVDGVVVFANALGKALLDADEARTKERLREGITHSHAGFTVLRVRGAKPTYFAILAIGDSQKRADEAGVAWALTPRQREVLRLVVEGCSNNVMGARLGVSVRTVEVHVAAIFAKVGVNSRAELVARALSLR